MLALQDLKGRDELKERLLALADAGSNLCLLLLGAAGSGKSTVARAYAQLLLCENRAEAAYACKECRSCRYVAAHSHPDLVELRAEQSESPIAVEEVRNFAAGEPLLQPLLASKRVFILDLDAINVAGQNLLLKTLESSAASNFFILLSSNYERVLKTVHSRAQSLNLPHLSSAAMCELYDEYMSDATCHQAQFTAQQAATAGSTFAKTAADAMDDDSLDAATGFTASEAADFKTEIIAFAKGNPGFLRQLLQDENFIRYYRELDTLFAQAKLNCSPAYYLSELYTALEKYKDKEARAYLAQVWSFLFAAEAYENLQYADIYAAWQKCLANLQANGSFELQVQAFLLQWYRFLKSADC